MGGFATLWFKSLAPRSIGSFAQLRKSFVRHFKRVCIPKKTIGELRLMKQGDDEPLKAFIERYHNMVLEVGALKVGKLWTHMRIQDTPDYATALEIARKFVLLESEERISRRGTVIREMTMRVVGSRI